MIQKRTFTPIKQNLVYLICGTLLVLLIPLTAMQFSSEVKWSPWDFLVMALLCVTMGGLFIVASHKFPNNKLFSALLTLCVFIYIWAELSVGVFTSIGH
ncbi:hypothetical protein [Thalassotalea sp. G2M2-11]|uniref:hypothetical protein n=1 Tax=Thalassotalea sp. G2M2-11 TaxID=2787627 RepID=UPI0019D13AC4|nr:hypothetical protein [Thalassotalea sp. G2M2-11]